MWGNSQKRYLFQQNLTVTNKQCAQNEENNSSDSDESSDTSDSEQSDEMQAEIVTEDFTDLLIDLPDV